MWRHSHPSSPTARRGFHSILAVVFATVASLAAVNASSAIAFAGEGHSQHVAANAVSGDRVGRAPAIRDVTPLHVALSPSRQLQLDVGLLPRDPAALAAYATAVSTPGNADYHHFLTEAEFVSRFGPAPASINAVEAQLRAEGLRPGPVSSDHLIIPVSGRAGAIGNAFRTGFQTYQRSNGQTAYANTSAPYLGSAAP